MPTHTARFRPVHWLWGRIADLGNHALQHVQHVGNMTGFALATAAAIFTPPLRLGLFVRELYKLGVLSLIIICVSGLAVGMVLGLQGYHILARFSAQGELGAMVGLSLIRELGPVITALLITGRAGSATAAEIAAMVATEQLDGLRMLSIDPVHLVVKPRAAAMLLVMPLLTAIFILFGLAGGYIAGVVFMGGDTGSYLASLQSAVNFHKDIIGSLVKSTAFGLIVSVISTYRGYTSAPTAAGVSDATTSTVVINSVCILLFDYVITALWGV